MFSAKYFSKYAPEVKLILFKNDEEVISPNEAMRNSIFIFDDVTCENQVNIRNHFSMSRHKQIDCFYVSQTYSKIPKQLIRDNVNLLIIFKQDDTNLRHIDNEHVNSDMSWQDFKQLCVSIWKDPFMFLLINKDCGLNNATEKQLTYSYSSTYKSIIIYNKRSNIY